MLLETKKVTKIFGGLHANSDIDFSIDEGEIVAIIGPNGSGKTTFYNVLTGISPATRGQIIFKGKSIEKMQPEAITRLGMARTFQNIRLFGNMTVAENIIIARHCRRKTGIWDSLIGSPRLKKEEAENQEYIKKCLEYVGIYDKKDWLAKNLPYGHMRNDWRSPEFWQQSRFSILLDEPAKEARTHMKRMSWWRSLTA
ncbi:MAG: ABC transporter ATP-binding protein [Clostridium sp.]